VAACSFISLCLRPRPFDSASRNQTPPDPVRSHRNREAIALTSSQPPDRRRGIQTLRARNASFLRMLRCKEAGRHRPMNTQSNNGDVTSLRRVRGSWRVVYVPIVAGYSFAGGVRPLAPQTSGRALAARSRDGFPRRIWGCGLSAARMASSIAVRSGPGWRGLCGADRTAGVEDT